VAVKCGNHGISRLPDADSTEYFYVEEYVLGSHEVEL